MPPGTTVIEVDGRPDPGATWRPNADATGLEVAGTGYALEIRAQGVGGVPVPLVDGTALLAFDGERLDVSGSGFSPRAYAAVYVLNPVLAGDARALDVPLRLGAVLVPGSGDFIGSWRLPPSVTPGDYILQVVATLPSGSLLTVDTGLIVRKADRRSLMITGHRGTKANERKVFVDGRAWDLNGERVTARVKLQGQVKYKKGSSAVVRDGAFAWQRFTGKKVYIYFNSGGVRSNRIIIPAATR